MHSQTKNNRIDKVVETALKNISQMIDVNTVIGKPIKTENGDYVLPVSKVTVGVLVGGGEYGKINIFKSSSDLPYSAGNGAIISIKPYGFLIKDINDKYKMISISEKPIEKIIEKFSDIFEGNNEKEMDKN